MTKEKSPYTLLATEKSPDIFLKRLSNIQKLSRYSMFEENTIILKLTVVLLLQLSMKTKVLEAEGYRKIIQPKQESSKR